MISVDDFKEERECVYKGEKYSVRDNGSVLRHPKNAEKPRSLDNTWTFGKVNKNGYMEISGARIHIIVATAFFGAKDTKIYVVDHIDTNRQNNRPTNLRWLTRLENILLNPITCQKIESLCGYPIDYILKNISILQEYRLPPNISWMSTVSQEEADKSYEKWMKWVQHKQDYIESLTPNAVQRNWNTPTEFLCCPHNISDTPIEDYFKNLQTGKIFCKNQYNEAEIIKFDISASKDFIVIQTHCLTSSVKDWYIAKISFENNLFVHTAYTSCFTEKGADKYYTIALGREWTGGDVFDDYC